jgi:hypothetical protein
LVELKKPPPAEVYRLCTCGHAQHLHEGACTSYGCHCKAFIPWGGAR